MTFYKYAGAFLGAIVAVIVIGWIVSLIYGGVDQGEAGPPEMAEAPVAAPAPAAEPAPAPAPAAAPQAAEGVGALGARLAAADAEAGKSTAIRCVACHSFDEGGANRVGPNLWGAVGRPKGSGEGFGYSDALAGAGGDWTLEDLDAFLADPQEFVPGTAMNFAGFPDADDRADVLLYLRSLSADPVPLPAP